MEKFTKMFAITGILTLFIGTDVALAGRVANRQMKQQKRIHQGIMSGELTRCEAQWLKKEQLRIQRHKKRAWKDGDLSPIERIRLEHSRPISPVPE